MISLTRANGFRLTFFILLSCCFLSLTIAVMAEEKRVQDAAYGFDQDYGTPQYGGILQQVAGHPRSLDPHMETYGSTNTICNNTMNSLLRISPDMSDVELDLAKSWRQIDSLTYEFKLHEGVRFHDVPPVNGREMTSADVKYSIERISGKHGRKTNFRHRYYFEDKLESIETPDKYTIIFKTKEPYAAFIRYIASPWSMIVPKEAVDEFGDLRRHSIGTGPFILTEYVRGSHFRLVRNPNYFKKGLPYLDGIHLKISEDASANFAAFMAKEYDWGVVAHYNRDTLVRDAKEAIITTDKSIMITILRTPPWSEGEIPIRPPFNDIRVRKAIALAIDKNRLIDLAEGGFGDPEVGPVPTIFPDFSLPQEDQIEFNKERAKELLAEAGHPNGFSTELLTMNSAGMIRSAQVIQHMLRDVGIEAKLTTLEVAQYFNRAYRFDYDLALHVTTAGVDPEEWLIPYYGDVATATYYKWSNKEIWEMIKKQSSIMDRAERAAYIQEIQRKIMADYPVTFLYSWKFMAARWPWYHRKRYQNSFQTGLYELTWLDLELRKKIAGR